MQEGLHSLSQWASDWQLNISITKCAVLHLGRHNLLHDYKIAGSALPSVREIRDLGVKVDSKLCFSAHYAEIAAKAHQRAGLILRCFKSRDPRVLFRAFTVYVRPIIEYCSPVWSPVYKKDIIKLEAVQRRFTKKLQGLSKLQYSERLIKLNTDTLELRRLKQDLLTMFKVFNGLLVLNIPDFFELSHVNTRGHEFKVIKPSCVNNARVFSFACRRIDCWNSLPANIVKMSLSEFRDKLNYINFSNYLFI